MMQKVMRQMLALVLALGGFLSCGQEASEAELSVAKGETVTLSLSAEVSVDDDEARAISYRLGKNAKDQIVPMPQFEHKQAVEVHTIIKSNKGTRVVETLTWRYDATKKKLVLKQDSHDITIENFNNDNDTKWYISGLIGGALNGTKVEFMGTRVVKGVSGNVDEVLGSMEVPYAFGWTELTIQTDRSPQGTTSYRFAEVDAALNVKFRPLGALIAVKLGNKQLAGEFAFTPKGFTLSSNAWGDQGSFELNTDIPELEAEVRNTLPVWTESACGSSMHYTFASGEAPGRLEDNETTDKSYYVWVMPHKDLPTTTTDVRVMMTGTSSRPETETYRDYTNTWFTDYTKSGNGRVLQGRVYSLTARASHRLIMPIEYVTEYNLAGGEGLVYTIDYNLDSQPNGVKGELRFADSHDNDQSGYYNWYKVTGREDATFNPKPIRNLLAEVGDKYYLPTPDQWLGIFPADKNWDQLDDTANESEYMCVGSGVDELRQSYLSDFSKGPSDFETISVSPLYAIRFKARAKSSCTPIQQEWWNYDAVASTRRSYTYPSALDNSMKCAYRFRRVGPFFPWMEEDNQNLSNRVIIDVVYLGEETTPTELSTISNDTWWSTKEAERKVISRTFPAMGTLHVYEDRPPITTRLFRRGYEGEYWSSGLSNANASSAHTASISSSDFFISGGVPLPYGLPVRLFVRRDK